MARYDHLPIWKDAVALAILLEEAVRRFPRYQRESLPLRGKYALGVGLRRQAYAVRRGAGQRSGHHVRRKRMLLPSPGVCRGCGHCDLQKDVLSMWRQEGRWQAGAHVAAGLTKYFQTHPFTQGV